MATRDKKLSFMDRLLAKLKGTTADSLSKDDIAKLVRDAEKEDKEEEGEKSTKDSIAALKATVDSIPAMIAAAVKDAMGTRDEDSEEEDDDEDGEGVTKDEAPEDETEEEKKKRMAAKDAHRNKTVDAATMKTVLQTVRAHAEILAPGAALNMPTHDAKMTRGSFADSMCNCKRKALDVAYRTEDGRKVIEPFLAGRTADFARMPAKTIDAIFTGAAIARGMVNDGAASKGLRAGVTRDDFGATPLTIDALNDKHRDFWKTNGQGAAK